MTLHIWSLYASAVLLLCLTPGPNSLLAVTNGVRFGVGKTLFSTLGCAVVSDSPCSSAPRFPGSA